MITNKVNNIISKKYVHDLFYVLYEVWTVYNDTDWEFVNKINCSLHNNNILPLKLLC